MKRHFFQAVLAAVIFTAVSGGCSREDGGFTAAERDLINSTDSIFRVLTIRDSSDLAILRAPSSDLSPEAVTSEEFTKLCSLMIRTVTHPSQDGVGIAGPQIGLNRRIVAVQRFDKEGEPFEVYPNIRIIRASDSLAYGPEGCLSVPERRGDVLRSQEIVIEYADIQAFRDGRCMSGDTDRSSDGMTRDDHNTTGNGLPVRRETIKGFTAVIFQHETDHLDGILYIDRL